MNSRFFSAIATKARVEQLKWIRSLPKFPLIGCYVSEGLNLDGIGKDYPKVSYKSTDCLAISSSPQKSCFFFQSGTIVGWNYGEQEMHDLIGNLKKYQMKPIDGEMEEETFDFAIAYRNESIERELQLECSIKEESVEEEVIQNEKLKDLSIDSLNQFPLQNSVLPNDHFACNFGAKLFPQQNLILLPGSSLQSSGVCLEMVAFSYGLESSLKLAMLERRLEKFLDSIKDYPDLLLEGKRLPLSRREVLKKLGGLMKFRSTLNLHSGLLEVPDLFWENANQEECYKSIAASLDIGKRVNILNKKLDYANEIAVLLRDRLSERHSLLLEWFIIILIAVEVLIGLGKL